MRLTGYNGAFWDAGQHALAMPLYTTDALVLRTHQLGEADRIVVFLTRDRGKKRGVATGARRSRSRFMGGLEPLTVARLAYYERERRDLVRLSYVEAVRSPMRVRDSTALGYVEYFAELLDECVPEADPSATLFRLGAATVDALVAEVPVGRLARYFEYWILRLQGIYPSLLVCQRCGEVSRRGGRIEPASGGFSCLACCGDGGMLLSAEAIRFLWAAAGSPPASLAAFDLSRTADLQLERIHRQLITAHLEKELKASRVLRAMTREL